MRREHSALRPIEIAEVGGDADFGVAGGGGLDAEDVLGEEYDRGGGPAVTVAARQAGFVFVIHFPERGGAGFNLFAPVSANRVDQRIEILLADERFEEEEHEEG